jgi:hypothetical protein
VQLGSAIALHVWRLDPEKVRTRAALREFIGRGSPHILNLHMQADCYPGQRMVAVEYHVLGINISDGKQSSLKNSFSAQSQINQSIQSTPPGHLTAKLRYFPLRPSPHFSQTTVLQQA